MGEAQFLWNAKKGDPGLDGKFEIGGWRHLGTFTDERFDANGLSLADPTAVKAATRRGDYGLYAVFEQKFYRVGKDDDRGIGIFARASHSPPDQNLIDLYADAGVEFVGLDDRSMRASRAAPGPWMSTSGLCTVRDGHCAVRNRLSLPSISMKFALAGRCSPTINLSGVPAEVRPIRLAPIPARLCAMHRCSACAPSRLLTHRHDRSDKWAAIAHQHD